MKKKIRLPWAGKKPCETLEHAEKKPVHEAAVLHIDIVGSTRLVQQDLVLAHKQIRQLYARLCRLCALHNGIARELRGDAAVAEFASATDAVRAALAIQGTHQLLNRTRIGRVNPEMRSGIGYGPIVSDDRMITGAAVIRAQRIEQLARPGTVLFDQSVRDQIQANANLTIEELGKNRLKGFDQEAIIFQAKQPPLEAARVSFGSLEPLACAC